MSTEVDDPPKATFNPYHDLFLAEWPNTTAARLEWAETRLGIKRAWLVRMLALEGKDTAGADALTAAEIALKYEYEVGCWTDVCGECLVSTGWDVDRFAALTECMKGKIVKKQCRDWIMEKSFSNWLW